MSDMTLLIPYIIIMLVIWVIYSRRRKHHSNHNKGQLDTAIDSGMSEPASLHPLIDQSLCIGCGSCVDACPEKQVLGLIEGKAHLINPASCIGHGACQTACPTNGITLVFGTEKRGVDIPRVSPSFETNVPGIYIAGELGGMGLIRNAVSQGVEAVKSISQRNTLKQPDQLDLIIIGAGPAGIAAALTAKAEGLSYTVLEQDALGGTIAHYPRGKLVMTAPAKLPLVGDMHFKETTKEELMAFWEKISTEHQLNIDYHARVEQVTPKNPDPDATPGFDITTPHQHYACSNILLAIGRRGTPRKLGVPGEDLPKVVYRLIDPEQYRGQHVLVVGGGDSALEAAWSIAEEPDTHVTLSYRSGGFSRAKAKNRERVEANEQAGRLTVLLNSNTEQVSPSHVIIDQKGQKITLENDTVIVCAGGILPTPFLKSIGIEVDTKFGTA